MKIRKITSLTAGLSFVLMVLTSVILYIVPQGRVAYWADWRLWGLTKTEWGNIHINLGLLFLMALFLHLYYNWKPITSYLKDKTRKMKVFTLNFNAALVITLAFTLGTYFLIPPFNWVITLGDQIKDHGAQKYGEPPYGHAELSSLKTFAQKMNMDLDRSLQLLEKAGYAAEDGEVTLAALAQRYGIPPQQIFLAMKNAVKTTPQENSALGSIPDSPPPGSGNLTLADFCARYNLNMKQVVRELKLQAIGASEAQTLKEIAANEGIGPMDLFETLKGIAKRM